jgi:drug/metabolite transporter (DMT)-like permease
MWSIGPLFVKHFTQFYNVWTQNAFRYGCAALMLIALSAWRGEFRFRLNRGHWAKLALVTFFNVIMQVVYAGGLYFIYPSVVSLVARAQIIFITVLSFLIFHDERGVILSPRFLAGSVLALGGVVLVIFGRDPELLARLDVGATDFWIGVLLALGFAFLSALYALAIKHAVRDIPPILSFTHVAWMTALALAAPMLILGGVEDLWQEPARGLWLMALSAFLSILVAHTCLYAALRHVKAVVSSSVLQLLPLSTCTFSALVFGDTLTPLQLGGGAAVLIGAWLAALAQTRTES